MVLALFLDKSNHNRAPGQFSDYLFVPKHAKADVLLTEVLGPRRCHLIVYRAWIWTQSAVHCCIAKVLMLQASHSRGSDVT